MNIIRFYKVEDEYGFLSNFAPYPIVIGTEIWKTVEHYFQASKFLDYPTQLKIKNIESPMKAAAEGRRKSNGLREDWDDVREQVMLKALNSKFLQHPKLRKQLILTNDNTLVEHTGNDNYWADGGDGNGKNRLGVLLMEVRKNVQIHSSDANLVLPPWIAFPAIEKYDMFWRMGLGENYIDQWTAYYLKTDQERYKQLFPENENWEGAYDDN